MRLTNRLSSVPARVAAAAAFFLLACGLTWPLPRYFQTHLLGDTSGDLGVYVWNLWIFRHELVEHGHLPLSTDHLFTDTDGLDFAMHNYTPLAGLLGVPLMDWLGIVGTFNVLLVASMVASALGGYLLARRFGLDGICAWSAGALFMASPVLTARGAEHFSLITAAPLPLFIWALLRVLDTKRVRDAVFVGFLVAVATYSDAYYGIYCALAGAFFVAWRFVRVARATAASQPTLTRALDAAIAAVALLMAWRLSTGSTSLVVAGIRIGLETLYTPVLAITLLGAARGWLTFRPSFEVHDPDGAVRVLVGRAGVAVATCIVLLAPLLIGIATRYFDDRLPEAELHWRSSAPGVDALAYLVPNPLHPWFGSTSRSWAATDTAFPEFVASFSLVAFGVIAAAGAMRALPRVWVAFTVVFVILSLGPFIHIATVNTFIPGPWALLRYVPIVGMARSPSRFTVLAVLGLSMLFAFALRALLRRRRPGVLGIVALAMVVELVPAPRVLYSADVPDVYTLISATTDEAGRVLELPTGVRDGTSSIGRFNPASQYFQTRHHRPLVGGYVSRISRWRVRESRRSPVLGAIFELSEGRAPSADLVTQARRSRDVFLGRTCVRFVVVDKRRASADLRVFARDTLRLSLLHEDATYQLLTPVDPPPCSPRRRRGDRLRAPPHT